MSTNTDEIDLDKLRQEILELTKEEELKSKKTKLLPSNIHQRHRPRKINPKFCYQWHQLDQDLQVNRLIEYVGRYSSEHDLPPSTGKKIRKLLVEALVKETLNVEYDSTVGSIITIPKLFFDPKEGYFLGTYLNQEGELTCRISKISKISDSENNLAITTEDFKNPSKKVIKLNRK